QMTLVNETKGVINANQATKMILNNNGEVFNTGLIEDTGTGGLLIQNTTVVNTGNTNAGMITATGAGATVTLSNAAIEGGTLTASAGAAFQTLSGTNDTLDGTGINAPIDFGVGTAFNIADGSNLYLDGIINNSGTITLGSVGNTTDLYIGGSIVT